MFLWRLALFIVILTLITLLFYIRTIIPNLTVINTERKINNYPKKEQFYDE